MGGRHASCVSQINTPRVWSRCSHGLVLNGMLSPCCALLRQGSPVSGGIAIFGRGTSSPEGGPAIGEKIPGRKPRCQGDIVWDGRLFVVARGLIRSRCQFFIHRSYQLGHSFTVRCVYGQPTRRRGGGRDRSCVRSAVCSSGGLSVLKPGMEERGRDRVVRWLRRKLVAGFCRWQELLRSSCEIPIQPRARGCLGRPCGVDGTVTSSGSGRVKLEIEVVWVDSRSS